MSKLKYRQASTDSFAPWVSCDPRADTFIALRGCFAYARDIGAICIIEPFIAVFIPVGPQNNSPVDSKRMRAEAVTSPIPNASFLQLIYPSRYHFKNVSS